MRLRNAVAAMILLLCLSCRGTSRFDEPAGTWEAGASLYSGRPDPTWEVTRDIANTLVRCLQQLGPAGDADTPEPPGLGYRGSWLRASDGREWELFGGLVKTSQGKGSTRLLDTSRNCERQLLRTAPAGVLPPGLTSSLFFSPIMLIGRSDALLCGRTSREVALFRWRASASGRS